MLGFAVSTDALRTTATKASAITAEIPRSAQFDVGAELGHARLTASVASFAAALGQRWQTQRMHTDAVDAGLRRTATIYDRSDDDGVAILQRRAGEPL